jgi:AraC family transcriptional regulator
MEGVAIDPGSSARLPRARGLSHETVARLHLWLAGRIGYRVRVRDMAAVACMSEFHFYRQFRLATGESPHAFLTRLRMEQARRLLEHTDKPLRELSEALGYRPAHFCMVFRRFSGATPMAYRRRRKREAQRVESRCASADPASDAPRAG